MINNVAGCNRRVSCQKQISSLFRRINIISSTMDTVKTEVSISHKGCPFWWICRNGGYWWFLYNFNLQIMRNWERQAAPDGHSHHEGVKPGKSQLKHLKDGNCIPIQRDGQSLEVDVSSLRFQKIGGLSWCNFVLSSLSEGLLWSIMAIGCLLNISILDLPIWR